MEKLGRLADYADYSLETGSEQRVKKSRCFRLSVFSYLVRFKP
jgi:hypothetical protein